MGSTVLPAKMNRTRTIVERAAVFNRRVRSLGGDHSCLDGARTKRMQRCRSYAGWGANVCTRGCTNGRKSGKTVDCLNFACRLGSSEGLLVTGSLVVLNSVK